MRKRWPGFCSSVALWKRWPVLLPGGSGSGLRPATLPRVGSLSHEWYTNQITGRCLCGSVEYRADAEPAVQAVCHGTDCQQTGSAFSVVVGVPRAALIVEGSTLASCTTTGEEHGIDTQRRFCSACGSPIVSLSRRSPIWHSSRPGRWTTHPGLSRRSRFGRARHNPGHRTSSTPHASSVAPGSDTEYGSARQRGRPSSRASARRVAMLAIASA
jgi:hypothetical protein